MSEKYNIGVLDPAPAMTCEHYDFEGTYQEAVKHAHEVWRQQRRTVTVRSRGNPAGYWYHRVEDGVATDRNSNSGVPAVQTV